MYSIVICTYNPDEAILSRCLNSIQKLDVSNVQIEVILVDNNSTVPLSSQKYVQAFCKNFSGVKVITEQKQGQTFARVAGIVEAKGDWVIFLDDDNEVEINYVQELRRLNNTLPNVGAWGPGTVVVDFIDGVDPQQESYLRPIFQERHAEKIENASLPQWQPFYPFGTGLCVRRDVLLQYASSINSQKLTVAGRDAKSLVSGEDTQIVFLAIKEGHAAGHSPNLNIKHLIPKKRLTDAYLKRLMYGSTVCNCPSLLEVFPDQVGELKKQQHSSFKFARKALKGYLKAQIKNDQKRMLDIVGYIGYMSGSYLATGSSIPKTVKWIKKQLRIE